MRQKAMNVFCFCRGGHFSSSPILGVGAILCCLGFSLCSALPANGEVNVDFFRPDGSPLALRESNIPHIYRDIMAGTRLTLIISSDEPGYWDGSIFLLGENRDYGVLVGRDCNDDTGHCIDSNLPAAGEDAVIHGWQDDERSGFQMWTDQAAIPGDWFVLDYNATAVGACTMAFYDYSVSFDQPIYYIELTHVPTRDVAVDGHVDYVDFAVFAAYWQDSGCYEPAPCSMLDYDADGIIDMDDVGLFVDFWLENTE